MPLTRMTGPPFWLISKVGLPGAESSKLATGRNESWKSQDYLELNEARVQ